MADKQPEALRLADALQQQAVWEGHYGPSYLRDLLPEAADELRRLAGVEAERDALLVALTGLLFRDEKNTCRHEETHRGGAIWEICDSCGAMWADDKGGKPEWNDPKEWTQAHAAIALVKKGGGNG